MAATRSTATAAATFVTAARAASVPAAAVAAAVATAFVTTGPSTASNDDSTFPVLFLNWFACSKTSLKLSLNQFDMRGVCGVRDITVAAVHVLIMKSSHARCIKS